MKLDEVVTDADNSPVNNSLVLQYSEEEEDFINEIAQDDVVSSASTDRIPQPLVSSERTTRNKRKLLAVSVLHSLRLFLSTMDNYMLNGFLFREKRRKKSGAVTKKRIVPYVTRCSCDFNQLTYLVLLQLIL